MRRRPLPYPLINFAIRSGGIKVVFPTPPVGTQVDLLGWWDASKITQPDSLSVSTWNDQSINSKTLSQATSANQSKLSLKRKQGLKVVSFDGVDDFFSSTLLLSNQHTIVVCYNNRNNGVGSFYSTSVTRRPLQRNNSWWQDENAVNNTFINSKTLENSKIAQFDMNYTANVYSSYLDGVANVSTTTVGAGVSTGTLEIGRWTSQYLTADICEILIFNKILTTLERDTLYTYLKKKWHTTPTDYTGLVGWYNSQNTINMAGLVSQMTDLSGAGNHLTQAVMAAQPMLVASGLNNLPIISFDGVDDTLTSSASILLNNVHSVFIVYSANAGGGVKSIFATGQSSSDGFCYRTNGGNFFTVADGISAIPSGSIVNDRYEVLSSTYNNPTITTYRDNTIVMSQSQGFNLSAGGLSVGNRTGTGEFSQCKVAELMIYNRVLTDDERYQITRYLQEKYLIGQLLGGEFNDSLSGWVQYVNGGTMTLPTLSLIGNEMQIDLAGTYANSGTQTAQSFSFKAGATYQLCWTARGAGTTMNIYIGHSSNPSSGSIYNLTASKQGFMFTFTTATAGPGQVFLRTSTPASTNPTIWLSNISLRKIT